jgi:hypothetical protein
MLNVLQSWLTIHPISRDLIFGVLFLFIGPLIAPKAITFWKFFSIPPQRLGVWILRARLSGAQWRLLDFHKIHDDLPYLIFSCLRCLFYFIASQVGFVLGSCLSILLHVRLYVEHKQGALLFMDKTLLLLIMSISYVGLIWSFTTFRRIRLVITHADYIRNDLETKILILTTRLRTKGIKLND